MLFLLIILIVILVLWLMRYRIAHKVQEKTMDRVMAAMGIPKEMRVKIQQQQQQQQRRATQHRSGARHGRKIPAEYAVDVEYEEIHTSVEVKQSGNEVEWKVEQQVTDVEWEEIA